MDLELFEYRGDQSTFWRGGDVSTDGDFEDVNKNTWDRVRE